MGVGMGAPALAVSPKASHRTSQEGDQPSQFTWNVPGVGPESPVSQAPR